jgi:YVTN family beta-propeller protein
MGFRGGKSWTHAVSLTLTAMLTGFGAGPAVAAPAASATRGYVYDLTNDALVVFDPATNTITKRIALGFFVEDYTIRPDGREIYLTDFSNDRVVVMSTANDAIVARIPVGDGPDEVEFTPDSRRAYVVHRSTLTVIDTATRRVTATVQLGANNVAVDAAVSPDGSRIYVAIQAATGGARLVGVVSTATNTLTRTIPLAAPAPRLDQVNFSPDGRLALVSTGHVIDTATETVTHQIAPLGVASFFRFAPDSRHVYQARACVPDGVGTFQLVDVASGQVVRTILTGGKPFNFDLTPDNSQIYIVTSGRGSITVLDTATDRVLDEFGTGAPSAPSLFQLSLTGTAPTQGPGQRFAPQPLPGGSCVP